MAKDDSHSPGSRISAAPAAIHSINSGRQTSGEPGAPIPPSAGEDPAGPRTPSPRRRGITLSEIIGSPEFVRLREHNPAAAWASFQRHLMDNIDDLVPTYANLKELISSSLEIETFLKSAKGATASTPADEIAKWLGSDDATGGLQ